MATTDPDRRSSDTARSDPPPASAEDPTAPASSTILSSPTPASAPAVGASQGGTVHADVAGEQGEAVRCPYCDKELPHSVLQHESSVQAPSEPSNRAGAGGASDEAVPSKAGPTDAELMPPPQAPANVVTTEDLRASVDGAESADTAASKATISDADIRRWSALAGVPVAPAPAAAKPVLAQTPAPAPLPADESKPKPFPLLPPPPGGKLKSSSRTSSRFGFFSRKGSSGSDSDSDSGAAGGYARLGAPDTDDDDDEGYESDKPLSFKPRPEPRVRDDPKASLDGDRPERAGTPTLPTSMPVPVIKAAEPPNAGDAELRDVLREVLERVQSLSKSHAELLSSHTSLVTSLKIARSNLVMAEANTEMLEEELRRTKATAVHRGTPSLGPRSSAEMARVSSESGGGLPPAVAAMRAESKSGFGFWNKKSSSAIPSPTDERPAVHRASSMDAGKMTPTANGGDDEVRRLRKMYSESQQKLSRQGDELEALKKGKKEIEAELEGLSQALFEEANKMVSDERRKRAEIEDNLREVSEEREALRETVKVLGGKLVQAEETAVAGTESPFEPRSAGEDASEPSHDEMAPPAGIAFIDAQRAALEPPERGATPNLDKTYAALRRSIHHVVDGPTPEMSKEASMEGSPTESDSDNAAKQSTNTSTSDTSTNGRLRGADAMRMPPPPAPLDVEPNPWG